MIKFNKPYLSGKELYYISQAIYRGQTAGNKYFTNECQSFFKRKWATTY